jgi:hypothetical protein
MIFKSSELVEISIILVQKLLKNITLNSILGGLVEKPRKIAKNADFESKKPQNDSFYLVFTLILSKLV